MEHIANMQESIPLIFSERFEKLCRERDMRQGEVASKANITAPTMSRILSGHRSLSPEIASRLAAALGTNTLELLEGTEFEGLLQQFVSSTEVEELQKSLAEANEKIFSLTAELAGLETERDTLQKQVESIATMETALRKAEAELATKSSLLKERDTELTSNRSKLSAAQGTITKLEKTADQARRWNGRLTQQNQQLTQAWYALRAQLNDTQGSIAKSSLVSFFVGAGLTALVAGSSNEPAGRSVRKPRKTARMQ